LCGSDTTWALVGSGQAGTTNYFKSSHRGVAHHQRFPATGPGSLADEELLWNAVRA
jgi:hypothetical protein